MGKLVIDLLALQKQWQKFYGTFDLQDREYRAYTQHKMEGQFIKWTLDLPSPPNKLLFAGDSKQKAANLRPILNAKEVITAGLINCDIRWDYMNDPPNELPKDFDLIFSQAMFEHLLDPYKHLRDLISLLIPGGHLIIHTHIPGMSYHRYPIDTLRFHPDWFEECAKKLGVKVTRRNQRSEDIFYMYQKEYV